MNVFVTGAAGFIGWHLVRYLRQEGHRVTCLVRSASRAEELRGIDVRWVAGDLHDPDAWSSCLAETDVVYHVAGITRVRRAVEYYRGNQAATERIVTACRDHAPRLSRLVYVSSQAAAGPSLDGSALEEEAPCAPVSDYGRSKMLGEHEVLRVRDVLPVTILRPSIVYGPRERDLFEYYRFARLGVTPTVGCVEKMISIVHVDDLVRAIALAGQHPAAAGQIYFVGSEDAHSMSEICGTIAAIVGTRPLTVRVPHAVVHAAGILGTVFGAMSGRPVFLNREKAYELVQPGWLCSVAKIRRQLGFRPRISLREGLSATYRWYCENGWIRDPVHGSRDHGASVGGLFSRRLFPSLRGPGS